MRLGLLDGQVVLVSGGTGGIGAACATEVTTEGAEAVVVTGRNVERGLKVVTMIKDVGTPALFIPTDLSETTNAQASVHETIRAFGRVDCVVNVAGLTARGTMLSTDSQLFDALIAVNLKAPFFIMREAIADMLRRRSTGAIVNIISISAHGGQPHLAGYVAAKAGLAGLTKNAAYAHRWDRIRINGLNIGWTFTPAEDLVQREYHGRPAGWQTDAARHLPMGRLCQPTDISPIVALLLSDSSGVVTGSIIDWDQTIPGTSD
jgi:NAD(P)-dependent dehydrogenase (short-subunit alcohol dehydrogenase family)